MAYLGDKALVEQREVEALQSQIDDIWWLLTGYDSAIWQFRQVMTLTFGGFQQVS